jgi:heme-degrading monooxygenase HmoA
VDIPSGSIVREAVVLVETVRVDEYLAHMSATSYDQYVALDGNLGTSIVTRDLGDGRSEVRVLSCWRDEAAIRAFAGEAMDVALAYPDDDEFLLEQPRRVTHWLAR